MEGEERVAGKVLIIDDEFGIREGCRRVLEPRGFAVETAASFKEGLAKIQAHDLDLVLLDVMLPDGRGIDLLQPMHQVDPDLVPVIITGYATVELAVEAIKAGAYDFISKPFAPDLLLITVNQGLERRRLSQTSRRVSQAEQEAADMATARKEAEELLSFKTAFTNKVAHELRTPVASAISLIRPLMRGLAGELNEQQQDILARIDNRLDMLMDLVNDLLSLAATRTVVVDEPLEPVEVLPVLQQVLERMDAEAQAKQIATRIDAPPQKLVVLATAKGLDTIASNLVGNAIKYTPQGGTIRIELGAESDRIRIAVIDTGMGIPTEDLERIGEEFFRARNAKRSAIGGTGLGLSIVKELVQRYGGTFTISSEVGQGTAVSLILPASAGPGSIPS